MNLTKLKELAADLPKEFKANAEALIARMEETVEGVGDKPIAWRPPIIKLVQATTDRSSIPKGTPIGALVIGDKVMPSPLDLFPLRTWKARQMWSPDQNEARMLCSSPDALVGYIGFNCKQCPHSKFDEEAKRAECGQITSVISITADLSEIFITNFAKTNYKIGTAWEGTMRKAGVAPYRRRYSMSSKTSAEYKNVETFVIETNEGAKRDTPKEIIPFIAELFELIGNDRKEAIENFYTFIKEKRQTPEFLALEAGLNDANSTVIAIEAAPAAEAATSVSPLAVRYQV